MPVNHDGFGNRMPVVRGLVLVGANECFLLAHFKVSCEKAVLFISDGPSVCVVLIIRHFRLPLVQPGFLPFVLELYFFSFSSHLPTWELE